MPLAPLAVAALFARDSVVVVPGLLDAGRCARLRAIGDHVLAQQRGARPGDTTNIAYLTDPRWFAGRAGDLVELLETVADPALIGLVRAATGCAPVFHNTQYFMEPQERTWDGDWHRDSQFLCPDPGRERARIAGQQGVHLRVALVADDHLEIVPGSHARWDTPEELAVRRGGDPRGAMPGARRIALAAGDGCLFHAWSIHRGRYRRETPRRTLDLIYGLDAAAPDCPPDGWPPAPRLDGLSDGARAFLARSIALTPAWGGHAR